MCVNIGNFLQCHVQSKLKVPQTSPSPVSIVLTLGKNKTVRLTLSPDLPTEFSGFQAVEVADARYKGAETALKAVETRMENIAFFTEKIQLVMDMGEAIVEARVFIFVLLPSLTCLQGQLFR